MKNQILILMIGLLLLGVNVYAQGDLKVNGKIGVGLGASNPAYPLDVNAVSGSGRGVNIGIETQSSPEVGATAFMGTVYFRGGDAFSRGIKSAKYDIRIEGASNNNSASMSSNEFSAQENILTLGNPSYSGAYTFNSKLFGVLAQFQRYNNNIRPMTFSDVYGFWSGAAPGTGGTSAITFNRYYHYYVEGFTKSPTMIANNQYGVYISRLSGATNNYGIALAGNGSGADIAFGARLGAKIYSKEVLGKEEVFVKDEAGNETQISPHDPVTGEWRFYSKNTKTGKVVEVNMEKLVKAVEKLTGETFMIETIEEIK